MTILKLAFALAAFAGLLFPERLPCLPESQQPHCERPTSPPGPGERASPS